MFVFISALLFYSQFVGSKAQLDLTFLDYEFSYYDPAYFKDPETNVWENHIFINITLIDYLPPDAEIRGKLLGATMGEYIVATGIDVSWPFCEFYKEPIFLAAAIRQFNITSEECPPKPGNYVMEDYTFDLNTLPDNFPPNYYLMQSTLRTQEKILLTIDCYVRVS